MANVRNDNLHPVINLSGSSAAGLGLAGWPAWLNGASPWLHATAGGYLLAWLAAATRLWRGHKWPAISWHQLA